jgi:hypothetical protein
VTTANPPCYVTLSRRGAAEGEPHERSSHS